MLIVPVNAVANQTFDVQLGGQSCTLNIYQKPTGLFMDVLVNAVQIIGGVLCLNLNRIVFNAYLGFVGDFAFIDTQGSTDPVYTGLGARYVLAYIEAADLPAGIS